jgi:hypothetical protein
MQVCIHYGGEHAIFTLDEENFLISATLFLLTFNDSFLIFSMASVDINKIMVVVFNHLLVCPWISVEEIILTLANIFISFFSSDFSGKILKSKMAAEVT